MATPDHTPQGRGYDTSLLYFDAANGYWDNLPEGGTTCPGLGELTDLWRMGGPATGLNNSRLCSQQNQMPSCVYEDELFAEHMVNHIAQHNASTPFFGFVSWHNCHWPPEVPNAFLKNFSFIDVAGRAVYAAKANFMDAQIGKVVAALKARGMYENTLIVGAADNGGPSGCANNVREEQRPPSSSHPLVPLRAPLSPTPTVATQGWEVLQLAGGSARQRLCFWWRYS